MRKVTLSLLGFLIFFFSPTVFAHPGRTAADGCHYCRTNCDKWGVPWNTRHCHGSTAPISPPKTEAKPIVTPRPTSISTSTPMATPSPQPQETPEVKGTTTQVAEPISTAGAIGGLGVMGGLSWGVYKLIKKLTS